jgi:membrane peptidoglycan carboxypeptidase
VVVRISWGKLLFAGVVVAAVLGVIQVLGDEFQSSRWQAHYLARLAQQLTFKLGPGMSPSIRFPKGGPFDERLGYSQVPAFVKRLTANGYAVTEQARMSERMLELVDDGLFPPFREKSQAGLVFEDCRAKPLFAAHFPERVYERFDAVPSLLVDSLLFIENRELLTTEYATRNPAVEWKRFGRAILDQLRHVVDEEHDTPGGSTLATQIEKYRHSPEGRTGSAREKLRQMASASVRAYLNGENTLPARRQIVVDYLNTVPLTAKAGYGEINGIGDGLWAWFGRDFTEVNRLLRNAPGESTTPAQFQARAQVYKEALALMIAQRRPAYYLHEGVQDLQALTDNHLRWLASDSVISPALRDTALPIKLRLRAGPITEAPVSFVTRKATTAMRAHLSGVLGIPRLYDLDRLDLMAQTGLNTGVQRAATQTLRQLREPAFAKEAGLYGPRLLAEGDDPGKIVVSITLFERAEGRNILRVQTDNYDQPFDINEGTKLDLGSTAKFRALVTYLELIAELHKRYVDVEPDRLSAAGVDKHDTLTLWAIGYLKKAEDRSLLAMLDAAMMREYSANPHEVFFTGGGAHTFENFDRHEDSKTFSVREGFKHSNNLLFIRMMRDVVRHVMYRDPASTAQLLENEDDPRRRNYLARFADREGREFAARFYKKYRGKSAAEIEELLLQGVRRTPRKLAALHRTIEPDAGFDVFRQFMADRLQNRELSDKDLQEMYESLGPAGMSLADRGYVAGVHPLELWVAGYLRHYPQATLAQVHEAGREERQDVYTWLFKTRHKNAQDRRIQSLLEMEAFLEIARMWRKVGYPFESLTPSYAAAIGSAGDRPSSLAELMGIIINKGMRLPVERIQSIQLAPGTPYETRLVNRPPAPERVLVEEVADVARRSLLDVVEDGTAKRIRDSFVLADGTRVRLGGKTGTGDHRFEVYGKGGRLVSSRVVSRSGTFMFIMGDRYFGTVTSYVQEPYAAKYVFTSGFSVQLLKSLAPSILPLLEKKPEGAERNSVACLR